jgi:hypothetical protein
MARQSLDGKNEGSSRFLKLLLLQSVAPLYLEELDCFQPRDMILLIQDLDWVLGVRQVILEQCHFRQHNIFSCDT